MTEEEMAAYVDDVIAAYRCAPGARGVARAADRRLAADLAHRAIPRDAVMAALLLATARRVLRHPAAAPLPPIASLHYFAPVVDEIMETPPEPDYVDYLRSRLKAVAPALVAATAPRQSGSRDHRRS